MSNRGCDSTDDLSRGRRLSPLRAQRPSLAVPGDTRVVRLDGRRFSASSMHDGVQAVSAAERNRALVEYARDEAKHGERRLLRAIGGRMICV
jgi:hypothetical protein